MQSFGRLFGTVRYLILPMNQDACDGNDEGFFQSYYPSKHAGA